MPRLLFDGHVAHDPVEAVDRWRATSSSDPVSSIPVVGARVFAVIPAQIATSDDCSVRVRNQ